MPAARQAHSSGVGVGAGGRGRRSLGAHGVAVRATRAGVTASRRPGSMRRAVSWAIMLPQPPARSDCARGRLCAGRRGRPFFVAERRRRPGKPARSVTNRGFGVDRQGLLRRPPGTSAYRRLASGRGSRGCARRSSSRRWSRAFFELGLGAGSKSPLLLGEKRHLVVELRVLAPDQREPLRRLLEAREVAALARTLDAVLASRGRRR